MMNVNEYSLAISRSNFPAALVFYAGGRIIRYTLRGRL